MKEMIKKMVAAIVRNWKEGNALMVKSSGMVIL